MRIFKHLLLYISLLLVLSSCSKSQNTRYYLDDCVSWARPTGGLSIDTVKQLHFYKIPDFKGDNLKRLVASDSDYLWLQISFDIPENLKYKTLGFVIPYLHYADEAYLNGIFIGGYGQFPPHDLSAQNASHFYSLPQDLIKWNNQNTIYVKVYIKGKAAVSNGIFIDTYAKAKNSSEIIDFFHSKIYLIFEGFFMLAAIYFLIMSKGIKDEAYSLKCLAIVNFLTLILLCYFFAAEIPWYQAVGLSSAFLIEVFLCLPLYWIVFYLASFIFSFISIKETKTVFHIRLILMLVISFITISCLEYRKLVTVCNYAVIFLLLNGAYAAYMVIENMFNAKEKQKNFFVTMGFLPLIVALFVDFVIYEGLQQNNHYYFTLYGWFATNVTFLVYGSHKYSKVFNQNQQLMTTLSQEVERKTLDLTFAYERLEQETSTTKKDIDMAAIVQQKFYPEKQAFFDGWEVSVLFDPMSKISGDLFDYYSENDKLKGISLFDVSGHGVSASLVAMLAKSIIFRAFMNSRGTDETVSTLLQTINERINLEKGEIQNYLTGILLRVSDFAKDGSSFIEMSDAGHPYPVLYSAKENKIITVTHDEYQEQYGAIGIPMTEVSFPNVDLTLYENDILLLYTDGLTEAQNEYGEEFGKEIVEELLFEHHEKTAEEITKIIHQQVIGFMGEKSRTDDITFIVLKRVPRWGK